MTTASEASPTVDPKLDGSTELDQRATFLLLFNEPAVRNYVIAAFSALAVIVLLLMQEGCDIGSLLIAIVGVSGVLLRWTFAPVFILVFLTYFMFTPTGDPTNGYSSASLIERRRFDFADVLFVFSILVYFIAQYRLYGLTYQAIAFEGAVRRPGEPHTRRPASLIRPSEIAATLGISFGLVIFGQLIWWFVTSYQIVFPADIPLQPIETQLKVKRPAFPIAGNRPDAPAVPEPRSDRAEVLSTGLSRFYLLVGLLFAGTLLARLGFAYWRLKTIGPEEGRMILQDGNWLETHRERVRVEKWRIWGRKRGESQIQLDETNRSVS